MWRGHGRSFDRSADAASGGYEQWSQQTRGDPSAELAARYAVPAGFGAPAAGYSDDAAGGFLPPGVAFTPAPFGVMEPPWVAQVRVDASGAEQAAAWQAQRLAMGATAQPMTAAPAPMLPAGMYAPAPATTTAALMTFQQRFGASATGQQRYDAGDIAAIDAAAGAGRFSAATMWAAQGPNGLAQAPHAGMSAEVTRRIFELGSTAMMREEQDARGAAAPTPAAAPAAAAQMMAP